jgi:hypothetical protein
VRNTVDNGDRPLFKIWQILAKWPFDEVPPNGTHTLQLRG